MQSPKVSILIPVYKGERYVAEAVESALRQRYENFEVIIVNDGSPDDSYEKIKPYLGHPKVKYIEQKNAGVASARNTGIRNSTGDLIGLLDQDDVWLPDKLESQVAFFRDNPDIGLVHADVIYIDDNRNELPHDPYFPANVSGMCFQRLFCGNPVMTATSLFRRELVDRLGGFDEGILYSDDYDLWIRIARDHPIGYIDRPLALYRLHGGNTSNDYLGIKSYTVRVLKKALSTIPDAETIVGKDNVKDRFYGLHKDMWRFCNKNGITWKGCRYYVTAFSYNPRRTMWDTIDPSWQNRLKWYLNRMKTILHIN